MNCPNCGNPSIEKVEDNVFYCNRCRQQVIMQSTTQENHKKKTFDFLVDSIVRIKTDKGTGTGFIISQEGHVLTNAHVMDEEIFAYGTIGNQEDIVELEVLLDGAEQDLDLCLLQIIDGRGLQPLQFLDEEPSLGDTVLTIGNPKNIGVSVSRGSISRKATNMYQLDLTVNPGNSGGPVIDEEGKVIGVISFSIKDLQGMGFAIPTKTVKEFIKDANIGGLGNV